MLVAVAVVDLVAVPVALGDARRAVQLRGERALARAAAGYRPRRIVPPRSPLVDDLDLLGHRRDDRELGVGVELAATRRPRCRRRCARTRSPCTAGRGTGRAPGCPARGRTSARRACPRCRGCRSRRGRRCRRRRRDARRAPSGVSHSSEGIQRILTLLRVREAAGLERLGDREVGVGQVDVLADQPDRDLVLRVVHGVEQLLPARPVDLVRLCSGRAARRCTRRGPARAASWGCRRCSARRPR